MTGRLTAAVLAIGLSGPALSADITMTLSDEEQTVLRQLLDVATKAGGLQVAPAALHFANKLENPKVVPATPPKPPATDQPK